MLQSVVGDVLFKENPEEKVRRVGSFAGAGLIFPLVTFDGLRGAVSRQSFHSLKGGVHVRCARKT